MQRLLRLRRGDPLADITLERAKWTTNDHTPYFGLPCTVTLRVWQIPARICVSPWSVRTFVTLVIRNPLY